MIQFNRELALKADKTAFETGVYKFQIVNCYKHKSNQSEAVLIKLDLKLNNGSVIKNVELGTIFKRDGSANYALNILQAGMAIAGLQQLSEAKNSAGKAVYIGFNGKELAGSLVKEYYISDHEEYAGKLAYKIHLTHFFSPRSWKTYSEHVNNEEATLYKTEFIDRGTEIKDSYGVQGSKTNNYNNTNSLPVAEGSNNNNNGFPPVNNQRTGGNEDLISDLPF